MRDLPVVTDVRTPTTQNTHPHEQSVGRPDNGAIRELVRNPPPGALARLVAILKHNPRSAVVVFAATVASSLMTLLQPLLGGALVGELVRLDLKRIGLLGFGVVVVAMVVSVITAVANIVAARAGNRTVRTFRDESAALALRVPARKLVDHPTADLVARCSIDSERMADVYTSGPLQALGGAVLVVGALVQMTILDPVLTAAALFLTLTCIAAIVVVSKRLDGYALARQEAQGAFVAECTRALDSVLVLRAFVADRFALRRLDRSSASFEAAANRADRARSFLGPMVTAAIQITLLLIVTVAVIRVQQGHLSVESLVAFFMFTMLIVAPIGSSADTTALMAETLGALRRILGLRTVVEDADVEPGDSSAETPGRDADGNEAPATPTRAPLRLVPPAAALTPEASPPADSRLEGRVSFRDVSVRYGDDETGKYAVRDISFDVEPGMWVALTGTSGSGKSTMLSLLEKFVTPTTGTVEVDGYDLQRHDDDHYRSQVGYIDQACPLFSGTVRDNLLLGRSASEAECWRIINEVGLGQVIGAREGALDAPVGESAYAFSGGERQRLAIARALLGNPQMLLLDEITSGLDVLNRDQIMRLIDETMGGITTFSSAHGRIAIDRADLVVVLDHGRLVEVGRPAEVRRRSSLFRSLIAS